MRAAARALLLMLVAGAAGALPAGAQVSQGLKRPGPVPYVELYGRKPVHKAAKARPRTSAVRSTAATSGGASPSRALAARPAPAPSVHAPSTAAAGAVAAAPPAKAPPVASAPPPPAAALPPPPAPSEGAPIDPVALGAFVDGAVAQARGADHAAGVVVSVVQNGQVLLEKGYGEAAPGRPMDPRATLVRLGSVSKVLTWIAALKAVEAGRLKLDAPVDAVLPPRLRPPAEGWKAPVTLRLLMEHAAGFEAREFGRLYLLDPGRRAPLDEALRQDRPRRVRAPGELSSYTSYDAALAGAMLEAAERRPFDAVIAQEVTGPIGMTSTTFAEPGPAQDGLPAPMPAALAARLAVGRVWTASGFRELPFEYARLRPALSASSTAADMARLMLTLLARGHAAGAGPAVWGEATSAALEGRGGGWLEGAGGLMRFPLHDVYRTGFGHDGATLGSRAELLVVPALGLGVFVAGDSDTSDRLVRRLPGAVVARFDPRPPAAGEGPPADPERYVGLYLSTRRAYHGLEGFVDRLTRLHRVRSDGKGALIVGGRGGRAYKPDPVREVFDAADEGGARLRFLIGKSSRAATFEDPGGFGAAERVGWLHWPRVLAASAALALLASALALAGPFVRETREHRQTDEQTAAVWLQNAAALLWIAAAVGFAAFMRGAADPVRLYTEWPSPWLRVASALALLAAILTLAQTAQLLGVWREGRRIQGWSGWRKLRHSLTVASFLAFAVVLASWGALEPWSG